MSQLVERQPTTALERVRDWRGAEGRRRAVEAARDRDPEALWDLLQAYLIGSHRSGAPSRHTLRAYRLGLKVLLEHWQGENLLRPGEGEGEDPASDYRLALLASGVSPATVNLRLAAARALYRALRWSRATEADPFGETGDVQDQDPADKREAYSDDRLALLLEAAEPVDQVVLLLGAHAALRREELAGLRWQDLDLEEAQAVVRGKGGAVKAVALSDRLVAALEALRASQGHPRRGRVLPFSGDRAYRRLRALCRRVGIEARGLHALRHSGAMRLYEESGDLELVRDHLRHSSITTTQIYARAGTRRAREAIKGW